ncbi:NUDIX hydrolase [Paenibacillus sp. PR3]|uniref:NUDIX hydrolase n=1 Tax=Paenibacillus terricola TaxID=2763503 RepID=A0ABR8N465_9BACL|nr:NUDIX hydrolase [Paenibacillus terricola]MBD3922948.1 NUDIX hydrolase [Paenibacillus terricola]
MITFERNNNKFNFRVAGIVIHNDRILLHTILKDDFWNPPGGRVEFNESTDQTIVRELREELDIEVQVKELLFVNEDFFEYDGKQYHEIGFYYLISVPDEHEILKQEDVFNGIEDDGRLIFKWFSIDQLNEIVVYPEQLKTKLLDLKVNNQIEHHITRQY